jgi:secretion/DNA translocation related CpaE-like protein
MAGKNAVQVMATPFEGKPGSAAWSPAALDHSARDSARNSARGSARDSARTKAAHGSTGPAPPGRPRVLVMVSEPDLLDAVLRLAAAAGCEIERVVDPLQARCSWMEAPIVLLDDDAAQRCATAGLTRREGVLVVVLAEPPTQVWQHAVAVGAAHVLSLPDAEAWLVRTLAEAMESLESGRRTGAAVAVVGGCGGAGASVLAAALAVTAVRDGCRALLVDCDPLGGGLDLVLGAEHVAGLRWPEIDVGSGHVPAAAWHAALPAPPIPGRADGGLALLSCDRSPHGPTAAAVAAVVDAGRRAGETVVCDLPRYPTEAAITALGAADLTVLVVPAEVRASAAAARVAAVLAEHGGSTRLVVRGPAPGGIEAAEISRALDLPLLVAMRPEPGLARAVEAGRPPGHPRGPLAGAARTVLAELARSSGTGGRSTP